MSASDSPAAMRERRAQFGRFNRWEEANRPRLSPEVALAAVGTLYELLPPASRHRAVDPTGVMRFHEILRRLDR